jgi:hypothetical protein
VYCYWLKRCRPDQNNLPSLSQMDEMRKGVFTEIFFLYLFFQVIKYLIRSKKSKSILPSPPITIPPPPLNKISVELSEPEKPDDQSPVEPSEKASSDQLLDSRFQPFFSHHCICLALPLLYMPNTATIVFAYLFLFLFVVGAVTEWK